MAAYRRVYDSRHLQGPDLIPVFGSLSAQDLYIADLKHCLSVCLSVCYTQLEYLAAHVTAQDLYIADLEHCLSVCLSVTHSWSTWQPV